MSMANYRQNQLSPHRWTVFGVISAVYFFVYFHRVSTSVIAPDLLIAFQTDATALGVMSSMYFYLYALEQPLVGYLSDRLGPRRVVGLWNLAAAAGCGLFGLAPGIGWAMVGRAFIGFGAGSVYVPGMKAFSQWFSRKNFATMTGLFLAVGNLGAIVATTPLAWIAESWGWRKSFLAVGGITLGLALVTLFCLRDHESSANTETKTTGEQGEQARAGRPSPLRVLGSAKFWVLALIFFGFFGSFLTLQGLWATPFLMSVLHLDRLAASGLNMLIPVGFIVGAPIYGRLTDRFFRNKVHVLIQVVAIQAGLWSCLVFGGGLIGQGGMVPILLAFGGTAGGFATALWGLVLETTAERNLGMVSGMLNPAPFLGVAAMQTMTGALLDRVGRVDGNYPPEAYTDAFTACLLVMLGCLLLCIGLRKRLYRPI